MSVLFITGIDTDIGKTGATGMLAKAMVECGMTVITQKIVQTGCSGIAEDILTHRHIMGIALQSFDEDNTTCPYVFTKPASPHLSSDIDGRIIDPKQITRATETLSQHYDWILLEGAGGLMVPLTNELLTIDYASEQNYPVILVTSGRLGSINHTLLSIEAIKQRGLELSAIIFNRWHPSHTSHDNEIEDSTREYLQQYLSQYSADTQWIDLPVISDDLSFDQTIFKDYLRHLEHMN